MSSRYWIIGPGRMGLSLGSVLVNSGAAGELLFVGREANAPDHPVLTAPVSRYSTELTEPPRGTTLVLAVPDGSIGVVAARIAAGGGAGEGCVALHLSGAQSAEVLGPLRALGYAIGSLHPLQTVAEPDHGGERLRDAFFTFEGDPQAREAAAVITRAAGGRMLEVQAGDKARYHAACVFASNYVVTCAAVATRLLAEAVGISREEAAQALQPLWGGAVANLDELGPARALTGPIARGDLETIRGHLGALAGETRELYRALAVEALEMSRALGLEEAVADAIAAEIRGRKTGGQVRR